jgi:hypothetical protein
MLIVVRAEREGSPFLAKMNGGGCSARGDVIAWRQQGRV